jgi:DNA-binding transcriptional MerR regulator
MDETSTGPEGLYPIRTVASLTGINPVTLRAWERRHGLIKPQRTPKGHRLYSANDIGQIRRILQLIDQGVAIGQVKRIIEEAGASPGSQDNEAVTRVGGQAGGPWQQYLERMVEAASRFDPGTLDAVYNDALALYPVEPVTRHLILPLLRRLRERRFEGSAAEAEAHFLRTYLRYKLGSRFHHQLTQTQGPRLVGACLPGETSEVELLLFGLAALTHGYRFLSLGPDVPLSPLADAVKHSGCTGLLLFANREPEPVVVHTQLPELAAACGSPVFVFGDIVQRLTEPLRRAGAIPLPAEAGRALGEIDRRVAAGVPMPG